MPTRSEAVRYLTGGAQFDFAEGYPSAFVVQLLRLLAECPADPPAPEVAIGPWIASRQADGVVVGAVSCAEVVGDEAWQSPSGSLTAAEGPLEVGAGEEAARGPLDAVGVAAGGVAAVGGSTAEVAASGVAAAGGSVAGLEAAGVAASGVAAAGGSTAEVAAAGGSVAGLEVAGGPPGAHVEAREGRVERLAVTVGYDVASTCEGRGYATEMLRLVCAHLLAQPGVVRVCADTEADHQASRRVMEKAGLTWRRQETEARAGRATPVVHYALDQVATQAVGPS